MNIGPMKKSTLVTIRTEKLMNFCLRIKDITTKEFAQKVIAAVTYTTSIFVDGEADSKVPVTNKQTTSVQLKEVPTELCFMMRVIEL